MSDCKYRIKVLLLDPYNLKPSVHKEQHEQHEL